MRKTLTFGIPCYNSQDCIDRCVSSILEGAQYAEDIQIVIVDDGSTDNTAVKADEWAQKYPAIVEVVHQENGGHGTAVMTGLSHAQGTYYKVVDSDDWLDKEALSRMLTILRGFINRDMRVDLFISNYVYEKMDTNERNTIRYTHILPRKRVFSWDEIGYFAPTQNLLMHSLCYRVDLLRSVGLELPAHTFYVDNIYAYVPLPACKTIYYADIDLYRYFIGREDQSVNEKVMIGRIDQQFRITRIMMNAFHLYKDIESDKLRCYMTNYFNNMMTICSTLAVLSDNQQNMDKLHALWKELKEYDVRMYHRARYGVRGIFTNLPTKLGHSTTKSLYHITQKIMKFN